MKRFWIFYGFLPILLLSVSLVIGVAGQSAAAPGEHPPGSSVVFKDHDAPISSAAVFDIVNLKRASSGQKQLIADERLAHIAALRAADMSERHYYAHRNPDGNYYYDMFKNLNLTSGYSCENLDLVFVPSELLVVDEWMNSLNGHRGCLLSSSVTHAGYASIKMTMISLEGSQTEAYVVVAIHAALRD